MSPTCWDDSPGRIPDAPCVLGDHSRLCPAAQGPPGLSWGSGGSRGRLVLLYRVTRTGVTPAWGRMGLP